MISRDCFPQVLNELGFMQDLSGIWAKSFANGRFSLVADCANGKLIYPEGLKIHGGTITHFSVPENFVVFECVHRLLEKGYNPTHIEQSPRLKGTKRKSLLHVLCLPPPPPANKRFWKNGYEHD
jgi:hypothetical protein